MRRTTLSLALALVALGAALAALLASAGRAEASTNQISIIQDGGVLNANAAGTMQQFRALGVTTTRVLVYWYGLAPSPGAKKPPKGFDGTDPNDYPASAWAPYDNAVTLAKKDGITVDFDLAVGAPTWAEGSGIPSSFRKDHYFAWKPNAKLYGQFVKAFATRYDGHFTPKGASSPLPKVSFWSLWNEPNFGQDLGPEATGANRSNSDNTPVAPMMYRGLVDAGWTALHQTGHGSDKILIGEFAAQGKLGPVTSSHPQGLPGNGAIAQPLPFIQNLYCVNSAYQELRGSAAKAVGCPTTAAASRSFRSQNPGLFSATGVADHPYDSTHSPISTAGLPPNSTTLAVIGNLTRTLDRVNGVYGSGKRYSIYSDEYGYITSPPEARSQHDPSAATAAIYLNWAEYLSYKNSRIASYAQYLLRDGAPSAQNSKGGFASGLEFKNGMPKVTYAAYRLPVYMPSTTLAGGRPYEIWGGARPSSFAALSSRSAQRVQIQFQKGGRGTWTTVQTVTTSRSTGYFDIRRSFTSSGKLRVAYTYPGNELDIPPSTDGKTVYSRTVSLTVR